MTVLLKVLYNIHNMINTVSITDLKQNTAKVVKKVKESGEPVMVLQRSEVAAVMVDPKYYQKLEQALEDLDDLQVIEDRKNEPTVPAEKIAQKLGLK